MSRKSLVRIGAVVAALAIVGGAVAYGSSDSDRNVSGPRAERATQAALEATGGGSANSVELDDENGATWEVEVTKPNGATVDVRLDEKYEVIVIEGDSEAPDDNDRSE